MPGKDWHASTVPECTVTTIATMSYIQQFVVPGKLWLLITLTPKGHSLFFFFSFLFFAKKCVAGRPGSKPHPSNQLHKDAAVLISGCMDAETSADSTAPSDPTRACGAMTNALVTVVREHYYNYPSTPLTNKSALLFFICQVCS